MTSVTESNELLSGTGVYHLGFTIYVILIHCITQVSTVLEIDLIISHFSCAKTKVKLVYKKFWNEWIYSPFC